MTRLLSERQLADQLGVHRGTLTNWRSKGQGPAFQKVGRAVRYDPSTVAKWLRAQQRTRTPVPQIRRAS